MILQTPSGGNKDAFANEVEGDILMLIQNSVKMRSIADHLRLATSSR